MGLHVSADGRPTRVKLGSRLTAAAGHAGHNFVSPEVHALVRRELVLREEGACIDEDRLSTNLLSSMPLAFNLLGPLSRAIRQAEVGSARTMIARTQDRFGLWPARLAADSAYGSAENLAWLVHERGIEPHIPVFDKSQRSDGTFSRSDFAYDHRRDLYTCPAGKQLQQYRRPFGVTRDGVDPEGFMRYRASKFDCDPCTLKPACCPNAPARKILRSIHEGARDMARDIATTEDYVASRRQRKKVEMLFAHLKRILKLDRLRLRGPNGARDEFHLAAAAQNLRKLAKLVPLPAPALA